jgi:Protein of unknown function (Hypoth_ymh)
MMDAGGDWHRAGCLAERKIDDPFPGATKRHRLFEALAQRQRRDRCSNSVLAFIKHVMNPVRYVGNRDLFEARRGQVNHVLAFSGLTLAEDGKLRHSEVAHTLSEAAAAASALRRALLDRKVHPDVLLFCRAELVADNYFHAVFEATTSVAEKLRSRAELGSDGGVLVDEALGPRPSWRASAGVQYVAIRK